MIERLTRQERMRLVAELCPKHGHRRPCDSFELARDRALEILGPSDRAEVSADYVLMKAVDRFAAGLLSLQDLYRCRVLAYYMVFAAGGEEWARWGLAAGVRPGDFAPLAEEMALEDLGPPAPEGPPWRG
ncbi:MAG: hypothetical protein K0Q72_5220 [Armatimonadetes bacterium]|jgi:hypothetical protein|nr:hypothetical protein [Armatimonadota bacterium]